jgi:hypothetical protein
MDVPITRLVKPKLECEVCQSQEPAIIVLVRFPVGFVRSRACGRKCTEAVHLRYPHAVLQSQLEASVAMS